MQRKQSDKIALSIHNKKKLIISYTRKRFQDLYIGIANDIAKFIASNQEFTQSDIKDNYKVDITSIIRNGYRMTSEVFANDIRKQLNADNTIKKAQNISIENTIDADIDKNIALFINNISETQAGYISNTLADKTLFYYSKAIDDYEDHINNLTVSLLKLKQDRLNSAIANIEKIDSKIKNIEQEISKYQSNKQRYIADFFKKKFFDKVVVQMSTQDSIQEINYAESSIRDIEATGLVKSKTIIAGGIYAGLRVADILYKQWNSILDDKTRFGHAMAYGQTIKVSEMFAIESPSGIVEYGSYPRANTFSLGNKINCRCIAVYFLKLS